MKIPQKISLAHLPTPIEKLKFRTSRYDSKTKGVEFLIKRDDYTGSDFLGNKIRKLEYLLCEAKKEKADIIFTCGGDQSNHARATASAAAKLGIKTRLYLWGQDKKEADGNLFLSKMYGAEIIYLNKKEFLNVDEIMTEERVKLVKKRKRVYVIPAGGSSTLGIWGYISFINEIKKQIDIKKIDGIFSACGSGGTAAGLLAGVSLNKINLKIYAVNVLFSKEDIRKKILRLAEGAVLDYKMNCSINESNLEIIDDYSTEGYKNISDKKIKVVTDFARKTGILLDPAYTGKAFCAYNDLVLSKGKGERIIFLHTGGIFGTFPKRKEFLKFS